VAAEWASCEAVLLPDDIVLAKTLVLPVAVEAELDSVLALQILALSPFDVEDTAYGWMVTGRDEDAIRVGLAVVSRAGVMSYIGERYDRHDRDAQELWAEIEGSPVVIRGFGERQRDRRYRRRLIRTGAMLLACLVVATLMLAAATAMKRNELINLRDMAERVSNQSAGASELRASIAQKNDSLSHANAVIARYPNPHLELARLTRLLDDDAYIERFSMSGREVSVRGRAKDASTVMKTLADNPHYKQVRSTRAISQLGNTGLEQFFLEINIAGGASDGLD
jgi:general secretion pathway protein L